MDPGRSRGRREVARASLGALAAFACLAAAPAALQPQGVEMVPQVGLFLPLNELGSTQAAAGRVDLGRRESALALGLAAELEIPGPLDLRGGLLYGTSAELPVAGSGCRECHARSSLLVLGATALLRPAPLTLARPYLLGGIGLKRYGLDDDDLRASGLSPVTEDRTRAAVQVGVGLELRFGLMRATVEVSDFVSRFRPVDGEDELQNDVFLMVGLRL